MCHWLYKIRAQNCEEIVGLPEDIVEEILSRLPVKSLLKFRCVSKSWRYLIDGKRFIKTHLQNSINSKSVAHHRIILLKTRGLRQYSLPSLLNHTFTHSTSCDEINVEVGWISLVGCCNGLVCILVDRTRFILWNPATKKSRNLPDFDSKMDYKIIMTYGFGFDELNNEYKVFGVALLGNGRVYSLTSNSWKVVEEKEDRLFYDAGVYARGKLHWCIVYKHEIVSFDLNSHVYGVIELPTYSEFQSSSYRLGVHSGRLIVVGVRHNTRGIDIWTMKEYGAKESWDKFVITPSLFGYYGLSSLSMGQDGDVLLNYRSSFMIFYNPKCDLFRYPEIIPYARFDEEDSGIYVESLVSLDPPEAD